MNREQELARLQRFYQSEMGDHLTYSSLAARVRDPALRALLERTAATERCHAGFWAERIQALGGALPAVRPPRMRLAVVAVLLWFLPPRLVIGTLELGETGAAQDYTVGGLVSALWASRRRKTRQRHLQDLGPRRRGWPICSDG